MAARSKFQNERSPPEGVGVCFKADKEGVVQTTPAGGVRHRWPAWQDPECCTMSELDEGPHARCRRRMVICV